MKILFLSRWYPFPPNNGSKLRIHSLLHGLLRAHDVTLLTFVEPKEITKLQQPTPPFATRTQVISRRVFNPSSLRARFGYFSPKPRFLVDTYSMEMAQAIHNALNTGNFDLIIASQFDMAVYSDLFQGTPAILEEVELGVHFANYTEASPGWCRIRQGLTWRKHYRYLARLLRNFQLCTVVSQQEKDILTEFVDPRPPVVIVPNPLDLYQYQAQKPEIASNTLVFTGSFAFEPNYAAMRWFIQTVLPLVRAQIPDIQLLITGDPAGKALPPATGVVQTGYVEEIQSLVAAAAISIAPLHTGGGSRLKILEAMALRTPVVATPKGAEGLEVESGVHLLIAECPHDFAQAIVMLLRSPRRREEIADAAYQLVQARYDTAVILPRFLALLDQVAA